MRKLAVVCPLTKWAAVSTYPGAIATPDPDALETDTSPAPANCFCWASASTCSLVMSFRQTSALAMSNVEKMATVKKMAAAATKMVAFDWKLKGGALCVTRHHETVWKGVDRPNLAEHG